MKQWHVAVFCALAMAAGSTQAHQSEAWGQSKAASSAIEISPSDPTNSDFDRANSALLDSGAALVRQGKQEEAIASYFDKAIAAYEAHYKGESRAIYVGRSTTETLLYMMMAVTAKRDAVAIKSLWADAYYLKAYALIELKRRPEARDSLDRALALSPMNSQYLSESAELYGSLKEWDAALAAYKKAEEGASMGPPELKDADTARAWRGQGFVYIELNRLEEAFAMYEKCLAQNPKDSKAQGELTYIKSLKDKRAKLGT